MARTTWSSWCTTASWSIPRNRRRTNQAAHRLLLQLRGNRGEDLEVQAIRRGAPAVNGEVKIFGDLFVVRQQGNINPVLELRTAKQGRQVAADCIRAGRIVF